MKTIELSLAKNYVPQWGLVEAIRELIANALDTGRASVTIDEGNLTIRTKSGAIPIEHLLLGSGSKTEDTETIGQFNEGLKLALLIIARENINHFILNGDDRWKPYINKSETFGIDCLHLDIESGYSEGEDLDEVIFVLEDLSDEVLEEVKAKNLCFHDNLALIGTPNGDILKDDNMKGQIFCGGVWVCENKTFNYGYNFNTDVLKLDRDRKTVSTFDISWQTKELWKYVDGDDEDTLVSAITSDKNDANYLGSYTTIKTSVADKVAAKVYADLEEDTVVTDDQDEYTEVIRSGNKAKYISNDALISAIKSSSNYKNPKDYINIVKPLDILVDFYEEWSDNMDSDLADAYQEMLTKLENLI